MKSTGNLPAHTAHNIFVSTGTFKANDLATILDACLSEYIRGLELSSGISCSEKLLSELDRYGKAWKLSFLVHNYFPVPQKPFVLNLASNNRHTLEASIEHCKKAVVLCSKLRVPFYSVHSGFCFHGSPEKLGKDLIRLPRIPMKDAEEIFVESLKRLCHFAGQFDVDIAIENNVLAPFNLVDSENQLFLGLFSHELLRILEKVGTNNLHVLLDVAHLKVSSMSLGLDPVQQIRDVAPFVKAVHLSENDGQRDSNQKVTRKSWFWSALMEYLDSSTAFILEAYDLSLEEIVEQLNLISEKVKGMETKE